MADLEWHDFGLKKASKNSIVPPTLNHFFCEFTEENIGGFVNQPIDDKDLAKEENVS